MRKSHDSVSETNREIIRACCMLISAAVHSSVSMLRGGGVNLPSLLTYVFQNPNSVAGLSVNSYIYIVYVIHHEVRTDIHNAKILTDKQMDIRTLLHTQLKF